MTLCARSIFRLLLYVTVAMCLMIESVSSARCQLMKNCRPPECRCKDYSTPADLPRAEIPQMVLFTFDDAVRDQDLRWYKRLFPKSRRNPNGCPICMTLFVQDKYTKYDAVRELHHQYGMEIAVHSVTHKVPISHWKRISRRDFEKEACKQKQNIHRKAGVPLDKIKGWRSPFLQPSGDTQFSVLQSCNFSYDSTLTILKSNLRTNTPWPFTLDYGWPLHCGTSPCPRNYYPGFWVLPVVSLVSGTNTPRVYVDAHRPNGVRESYDYLWKNFESYYTGIRTPFMLNMHSAWFNFPQNLKAMDDFIKKLVTLPDVYIVTIQQALDWMKNPVSLSNISQLPSWGCPEQFTRLTLPSSDKTTKESAKPVTTTNRKHSSTTAVTSSEKRVTQPITAPTLMTSTFPTVITTSRVHTTVPTVSTASTVPTVITTSRVHTTVPTVSTASTVPTVTTTSKGPIVNTLSTVSTVTTASTVPTVTTSSVPTVTTASKGPTVTTASMVPTVTTSAVPTVTTTSSPPAVTRASTVPKVTTTFAVPIVTSTSTVPTVTTTSKVSTVTISTIASTTELSSTEKYATMGLVTPFLTPTANRTTARPSTRKATKQSVGLTTSVPSFNVSSGTRPKITVPVPALDVLRHSPSSIVRTIIGSSISTTPGPIIREFPSVRVKVTDVLPTSAEPTVQTHSTVVTGTVPTGKIVAIVTAQETKPSLEKATETPQKETTEHSPFSTTKGTTSTLPLPTSTPILLTKYMYTAFQDMSTNEPTDVNSAKDTHIDQFLVVELFFITCIWNYSLR